MGTNWQVGTKILLACLTTMLVWPAVAMAECSKPCSALADAAAVRQLVEDYVARTVKGESTADLLSTAARITRNGQVLSAQTPVMPHVTSRGTYSQTFVDDSLAQAVFFGAFREGDGGDGGRETPLLVSIRFKFEQGVIVELEHLHAREDELNWLVGLHELVAANPVFEAPIPTTKRATRTELIAAAHAYFDGIASSEGSGVAMHPECVRRENGVRLLFNPEPLVKPCPIGFDRFNYITDVRDRRLAVVDEARGLVLMYAFFDIPGTVEVAPGPWASAITGEKRPKRPDPRKTPRSLYIAELFRVEDGQIKDIAAIMHNLKLGSTSGWQLPPSP